MRAKYTIAESNHLSHIVQPVAFVSHTGFDPLMTHLDECATTLSKYASTSHKAQLLTHLIRRTEQDSEFHHTIDSMILTSPQRTILQSILSRLRKKELIAIRLVEQKILALLKEKTIRVQDYRYVMHLIQYEKHWTIELTPETFDHEFPIEVYQARLLYEKVGTEGVEGVEGKRVYGGVLTECEEFVAESEIISTEKVDFKIGIRLNSYIDVKVLADVQRWIVDHLEDPVKEAEQVLQKLSKYREPPRTLVEEMQRLKNVWENTGSDKDYKRKVYSELFPPRSVVLSLEQNTGVQVQRLEESVLQTKVAESKYEKKEYGAWYLASSAWESNYKSKFAGKVRSAKSIEEEATRTFVRTRLDEVVKSLK